jgi:hypothetical protein
MFAKFPFLFAKFPYGDVDQRITNTIFSHYIPQGSLGSVATRTIRTTNLSALLMLSTLLWTAVTIVASGVITAKSGVITAKSEVITAKTKEPGCRKEVLG